MSQQIIDLLEEMRVLSHSLSHTFTLELAHETMSADYWANLQNGLKEMHLRSQDAYLMVSTQVHKTKKK